MCEKPHIPKKHKLWYYVWELKFSQNKLYYETKEFWYPQKVIIFKEKVDKKISKKKHMF